jgi:predicted metal-dependent enzyme (double-stranded beta helix superfamily)
MFDVDSFIADCHTAADDPDPRSAVRELLQRAMSEAAQVAEALGGREAGLELLHVSDELTVLNVTWAPHMAIYPHDHRMWAAIGIYSGAEDNTVFRRGPDQLQAAGARLLDTGDVFGLGPDAIHAVRNPHDRYTGAIHVYGGNFVEQPRSQWDPDSLMEQPYDMTQVRELFAQANREWRAQLGHDLDESAD